MSDPKQSIPCTCQTCPGMSCTCGCQKASAQAANEAACACGPLCQCGQACNCPKS